MYSGYRVKINGIIIQNVMIKRGSFSCKKVRRTILSKYDAAGVLHEIKSAHETYEISFTIRERSIEEHAEIMQALQKQDQVTVEFWNDFLVEYSTGIFRIEDFACEHTNVTGDSLRYKDLPLTLKEY